MELKFFLFLFSFLILCSANVSKSKIDQKEDSTNIEEWCSLQCPFQNKSSEIKDGECGSPQCYIGQCSRGCGAWQAALKSNCQDACNATQKELLPPPALYCVMGCNFALNRHFENLRDALGTPPTPALQADTLTATSLSLDWSIPDTPVPNRLKREKPQYRIKWRYEEYPDSNWQYFRDQPWSTATSARLDNLQPYTKYRFRVAALVSPHVTAAQTVLESAPSVVICTHEQGPPAYPPSRVRATAVDSTHVSVTWAPAPFPHGRVLSYVLHLSEVPATGSKTQTMHVYSTSKDVTAPTTSYMFQNVPPGRNFILSVSTRNWQGIGPSAVTTVTTPPEPEAPKNTQDKVLLIAARNSIIRQSSDFIEDPVTIYNSTYEILGIAVHADRNLLFFSDASGSVSQIAVDDAKPIPRVVLTRESLGFAPRHLNVDWLNDQLYVVGERSGGNWQVSRCRLDGQGVTVAVAGFTAKPWHLQIDPYNGYMFWVTDEGLHSLDLAEVSNGVKRETKPNLILGRSKLGAFAVDHASFRLLVADLANNTILAVSLDGNEVNDIRRNTAQPLFNESLQSLVTANGILYWSNGTKVFGEEYKKDTKRYYHHIYPELTGIVGLVMLLPAAQPTPVPVNPPSALQAILGHRAAKLTWQPPHLLGGQGKGAWLNWSYEVQLLDEDRGTVETRSNVTSTSVTLSSIHPDTQYSLKVCAYTSAGRGPWSAEFRGRSFSAPKPNVRQPILVWGADEGLMQSDTTGDRVETLIHADSLKNGSDSLHMVGVAWYEDMLYLATNASYTLWFNLTSREQGHVEGVVSAGSIAVDWLGRRLYWSNPKQQVIRRGSLTGGESEPLSITTVAKELHIDSVNAYIYWSTGYAVECARLNGQHRHTYYQEPLFSGKQVMGMTLDHKRSQVLWIVRSYEESRLYSAPLQQLTMQVRASDSAPSPAFPTKGVVQGPLCYYSDHLLWLQDRSNAAISNLTGGSVAVISGPGLSGLNMLAVIDPALHVSPIEDKRVSVIPVAVRQESIRLIGSWDNFNVTWSGVNNVNYGRVFYKVKVWEQHARNEISMETDKTSIQFPRAIPPYSLLEVSVRAFTYWGSSPPRSAVLMRTPAAPPSSPVNPRAYISISRAAIPDIRVQYRWDPPFAPNGLVEAYRVRMCLEANDEDCKEILLDSTKLEVTETNLLSYSHYSFQVWARTSAGEGIGSEIVSADTNIESPVPRLLVGTQDSLSLTDCDRLSGSSIASQSATTVIRGEPLSKVAFLAADQRLYWLNYDQTDIFSCMLNGSSLATEVSLSGTGTSLTLDWVARNLYWAEKSQDSPDTSIWRLQLQQKTPEKILTRSRRITTLQVFPLVSALYWVEATEDEGQLMTSGLDGSNPRPFFSNNSSCSCPRNPLVTSALALNATEEKLLWSDARHGDILAADLDGCNCQVVVSAFSNLGLPATALTTDRDLVYWSGGHERRVYSASIMDAPSRESRHHKAAKQSSDVTTLNLTGVRLLMALGTHLQPYPDPECLDLCNTANCERNWVPVLVASSSHSLTLKMPKVALPLDNEACQDVSLPSPHYHLYYAAGSCDLDEQSQLCNADHLEHCSYLATYDTEVVLQILEPFTCYSMILALGNYYRDYSRVEVPHTLGPLQQFQTRPGVPSEARNITARSLSPWSIQVSWLPPEQFHGSTVRYKVLWITVPEDDLRPNWGLPVPAGELSYTLDTLLPGQPYLVWVRTYSESNMHSDYSESEPIEGRTPQEPRDIVLHRATPYSITVLWQQDSTEFDDSRVTSHVQMRTTSSGAVSVWHDVPEKEPGVFVASGLMPKTGYQFRVSVQYPLAAHPFTWPPDKRFTFETEGDSPSVPGTPKIQHVRQHVYQVSWEPSRANGEPVDFYLLEGRAQGSLQTDSPRFSREAPVNGSTEQPFEETEEAEWQLFYNGSDNYCIISADLSVSAMYSFRVCAQNKIGISAWSSPSEVFDWSSAAPQDPAQPTIGMVLAAAMTTCAFALTFITILYFCRRRERDDKSVHDVGQMILRTDVELATLREIPRGRSGLPLIQHTNILYTSGGGSPSTSTLRPVDALLSPTDQDIALLPRIRRDQIKLTKFLGSGAFGEVFEGEARDLPDGQQKVAVKSLRKGATEQEKNEFLKEAQLMTNFRHEHILQLLGVCLDNDPNFLIMELMEGGDLLSHLRASRPLARSGEMTLLDLVAMSVDVARGCRYLEEMHYVHRDLACRNCLVSFEDGKRVVKIGDFGLARDIYKNDYYRKEGEGLLPVRWMAPESLMDGVFTTQSDAWAFGVLVWEILTLGQQPYPARTNLEVLQFVRGGGRLNRPINCPDAIHQIMLKCWSYNSEGRPTFKYCLEVLEQLKLEMESHESPTSIVSHYVGHASSGMDNEGFYDDERYTGDRPVKYDDEVTTFDDEPTTFDDSLIGVTVSLPPETSSDPPNYLEVIMDGEDEPPTSMSPDSGYEVPRQFALPESGYEMPRHLPTWIPPPLEFRPRALSASCALSLSCDEMPTPRHRLVKRPSSVERLLTRISTPYSNIASSQPLLQRSNVGGDNLSDSSGVSSQLESVASGEMCTN